MEVHHFRNWGELTFTKTSGIVIRGRKNWPKADQRFNCKDPRNNYLFLISVLTSGMLFGALAKSKSLKTLQKQVESEIVQGRIPPGPLP